jgi:hypothetical protein
VNSFDQMSSKCCVHGLDVAYVTQQHTQERAQVANKRADELQKEKERKKRESAALAQTSAVRAALIRCASSQTGNACAHMPRLAALSKSGLPKLENACSAVVLFCWWCWCELVPTSVRSCA